MTTIRDLGEAARIAAETDYGSEAYMEAVNTFHGMLQKLWPTEFDDGSEYANFCLKATDSEMVDEAYRILGDRVDTIVPKEVL